ncbi:hypothetical protein [Methylocaldum gracile]|jgi:hypothetical protein|uniref:hypothetical protein n=1 Tax=unclassified Methylocaldum TaxID=2622260 RepID=UPI0010DCB74E
MRIKQGRPASSRRVDPNGTRASESGTTSGPEFPSARYFQIHFEYLEELLGDVRLRLDALRQQVADFQQDSSYSPADNTGCQPSGQDSRIARQVPEECGTEAHRNKSSSVGPTLSLQGVEKCQKSRRKTTSTVAPIFGTVSQE